MVAATVGVGNCCFLKKPLAISFGVLIYGRSVEA